jgi:hypothetical protein
MLGSHVHELSSNRVAVKLPKDYVAYTWQEREQQLTETVKLAKASQKDLAALEGEMQALHDLLATHAAQVLGTWQRIQEQRKAFRRWRTPLCLVRPAWVFPCGCLMRKRRNSVKQSRRW